MKIYTALDYAIKRDGVKTVKERVQKYQRDFKNKGMPVKVTFKPVGKAIPARIYQSHWIADCECGGAEFVDYNEPVFFCWGCGNQKTNGAVRPVLFPRNREKIEAKILERPVVAKRGLDDMAKAESARAEILADGKPLTRSWVQGETLAVLGNQQDEAIRKVKDGILK